MKYETKDGKIFFDSDLHEVLNDLFYFRTADYIEDCIKANQKNNQNSDNGLSLSKLVKEKKITIKEIINFLVENYDGDIDTKEEILEILEDSYNVLKNYKKYDKLSRNIDKAYNKLQDSYLI